MRCPGEMDWGYGNFRWMLRAATPDKMVGNYFPPVLAWAKQIVVGGTCQHSRGGKT